ncbi:hypothetical protein AMS68_002454 [Peltaster fructicola]|uniref:Uncharacterized protein n=1 Tax=Peltaster fructicola TaxID=286661 RepID=A0A6H0XQA5_9PEZI|nr:hypothetical protein AMS68_002454 [Peltaster fructicola]
MKSPPSTPAHIRQSSRDENSPSHGYRGHFRKRTSSFSSNHDRSPITPRSQHRFSNASAYSGRLSTLEDEFGSTQAQDEGGMGNLADELDQLDNDEEYEDDMLEEDAHGEKPTTQEAVRDSGIDNPPDEDDFSPTMNDAMNDVSRIVKQSTEDLNDQTITQFRASISKLHDQTAIETGMQRLNTSTNSMAAHVTKETKNMQTLTISLLSPFGLRNVLDYQALEDSLPLIDALVQGLPQPDTAFLQAIQKLMRETENTIQTNLSLADTVQDYKQPYEAASRYLREARKKVATLRVEQEEADIARLELSKNNEQTSNAASQCEEIVSGFETFCEGIRSTWSEAVDTAA